MLGSSCNDCPYGSAPDSTNCAWKGDYSCTAPLQDGDCCFGVQCNNCPVTSRISSHCSSTRECSTTNEGDDIGAGISSVVGSLLKPDENGCCTWGPGGSCNQCEYGDYQVDIGTCPGTSRKCRGTGTYSPSTNSADWAWYYEVELELASCSGNLDAIKEAAAHGWSDATEVGVECVSDDLAGLYLGADSSTDAMEVADCDSCLLAASLKFTAKTVGGSFAQGSAVRRDSNEAIMEKEGFCLELTMDCLEQNILYIAGLAGAILFLVFLCWCFKVQCELYCWCLRYVFCCGWMRGCCVQETVYVSKGIAMV